eukprot:scaffold414_cov109-Cylindrotheca_fusiformis.AAC.13
MRHFLPLWLALSLCPFSTLAFSTSPPSFWTRVGRQVSQRDGSGICWNSKIDGVTTDKLSVYQHPQNADELCAVIGPEAQQAMEDGGWNQIEIPVVSSAKEAQRVLLDGDEQDGEKISPKYEEESKKIAPNNQAANPELDTELAKAVVDYYKTEEERETALTSLVQGGASIQRTKSMMRAASDARYGARTLKILLGLGGSVHDRDAYGSTPLHVAAVFCNADAAEILLAEGADLEATDNDGLTPKMVLAKTVERNQNMEMEFGTTMPVDDRKRQDRIQSLFDAL